MRVARRGRGRGTRIRHRPMSLTEDFAWWAGPAAPSFLPSHGSGRSQKQDEQRAVGCRQRRKRERVDDNSWRERHSMRIDESLGLLLRHASALRQQQRRLLMTVASMAMPLFRIRSPFSV
ncbi:hypothetical protein B296_00054516 [Ensete ventricosum]|uniref:Uncharacterized protein n=1 Tax=Ensete ventricosum TaxID=4639 RepID=A0A426X311_ENSVE|nr:hypothetical protein B296_00054516 [Ensete ventricosum]